MPFNDQDQDTSDQEAAAAKAKADSDQLAADQAAQAAAAAAPGDHTSVFLVAGERAFKDADSTVKHIEHAQSHISTLEAERQTDRDQIATQAQEIERLKKIEDGLDGRPQPGKPDQTDQMSNEQIAAHAASLAVGLIQQNNTADVQKANLALVETAAEEAYGKDYHAKVGEIAKTLGMTLKAVDALGQSSPDAFKRLFLPTNPGQPYQPTRSSVNHPAGTEQQSDQRPVNIVKMRERERISTVAERMKAAGVAGY